MKFSRRALFKDFGIAGVAAVVGARSDERADAQADGQDSSLTRLGAEPSMTLLRDAQNPYVQMTTGDMIVTFDLRYGSISSLRRKDDQLGTNYIGNAENTPGVDTSDSRWTGDVVTTVWRLLGNWKNANLWPNGVFKMSGEWKRELTGKSADIRRVQYKDEALTVNYDGESTNEEGIRSYRLAMSFHPGEDKSLLWDIELQNITGDVLEFGELGFPLFVNDDYAELYFEPRLEGSVSAGNSISFEKTPLFQKLIHEQKVFAHHFISGHSSYSLLQRPLGDPPFLLVHPTVGTAFECLYKDPRSSFATHVQDWPGPDILAVHSRATQVLQSWMSNPWVNGHTSLVLQPGEKKSYQMRFVFVSSYDAIRDELYKVGNLGIRVMPSMVVQEESETWVELKSREDVGEIEFLSDNIEIKSRRRTEDKTLLTLSFKQRGQKSIKLHYGEDRWANLHFYCIEDIEGLLKARGEFIVERQICRNPNDPYHRYQGFLPFDCRIDSTFLASPGDVWEVGDSDEFGFSEPVFLAQKNVCYPSTKEIDTLETYVSECLFNYIQNPQTYAVRASLYWEHRLPSSSWGDWDEKRSEATFRTYNYVHPAVIYHALYVIGKRYGLLTRRTPEEYLHMAYQTCMKWFTTGPWKHVGLMEGSVAVDIVMDIKSEGWQQEYNDLLGQMRLCEEQFVKDPYPYGSELMIDQTAHQQVYFFTKFFGDTVKNLKTVQVIKALRGGNQPVWFMYGNDKRGDMACWYTESLNGMALLDAFESSGDMDAFVKGYAGTMSVAANLLPSGMGFGWFIWTPGVFANEPPRTLDNGIGQWGFLKGTKSYVLSDKDFGLVGCGCRVEESGSKVTAYPKDGVRKRLRFVSDAIDLDAKRGEIASATIDRNSHMLSLQVVDSTGLVEKAEITMRGLEKGIYKLSYGGFSRKVRFVDELSVLIPLKAAADIRIIGPE